MAQLTSEVGRLVRMPDGVVVRFPPDMPDDQIRTLIRKKFPTEIEALLATQSAPAPLTGVSPDAASADFNARFEPPNPAKSDRLPIPATLTDYGAPTPPPEPNWFERNIGTGDEIARALKLGVQDVGRGAADIAGAPFDLTNAALNLGGAGVSEALSAVGGPSFDVSLPTNAGQVFQNLAAEAATAAGAPPIPWEQRTPAEKLAGRMNEFGTQALAVGGGLATKANAMREALQKGAPRFLDRFIEPYVSNAPRTVAGDVASGMGSGAAVNAVEQNQTPFIPDWLKPAAEVLAAMAGGIGGSTAFGAAGSTVKTTGSLLAKLFGQSLDKNVPRDPLTGRPVSKAVVEEAASRLQNAARNPTTGEAGNIAAAREIGSVANLFKAENLPVPTSGLISDNIGLRKMESAQRTKNADPFIQRDEALRAAATDRVNSLLDPGADQGAVKAQAQTAKKEQLSPFMADLAVAQANKQMADAARTSEGAPLAPLRGSDKKAQASAALDQAVVDKTYLPARAGKNEQFKAVPSVPVDAAPIIAARDAIRANVNPYNKLRDQMPEVVDRLDALGAGGSVNSRDLVDLWPSLASAQAQARAAGSFTLADNIGRLKTAINDTLAGVPEYAGAQHNYKTNYAPKYRAGPGNEMQRFTTAIDRDATRSTTPPEKTAGRFLTAPEKADSLQRVLATSPDAATGRKAVRDYLMADYAASVLNPTARSTQRVLAPGQTPTAACSPNSLIFSRSSTVLSKRRAHRRARRPRPAKT